MQTPFDLVSRIRRRAAAAPVTNVPTVMADGPLAELLCNVEVIELTYWRAWQLRKMHESHAGCLVYRNVIAYLNDLGDGE